MSNSLVSELICTRLSHDIVGNVGAVANAVELLEEGDMDFIDDIKSILNVSSKTLSALLKFFRMTFGLDNLNLGNVDIVKKTAQDYLLTLGNKDFPINLVFNITEYRNVKNALLLIMIMGDILIRGGNIIIEDNQNSLSVKIDKNEKLSTDKLEKIKFYLSAPNQCGDAGLAPLVALYEYNSDKKIKLVQNDTNIMIVVE